MVDDDTWPPEQPTNFTPLLLIHHQGGRTPEQLTAMAEMMHADDIQKTFEGAPGIGKTSLLKEIANRWGNKQLLQKFELVLLISFRDPSLQQIKSVSNLLQLFYKGDDNTTKVVSACSEYLSKVVAKI